MINDSKKSFFDMRITIKKIQKIKQKKRERERKKAEKNICIKDINITTFFLNRFKIMFLNTSIMINFFQNYII